MQCALVGDCRDPDARFQDGLSPQIQVLSSRFSASGEVDLRVRTTYCKCRLCSAGPLSDPANSPATQCWARNVRSRPSRASGIFALVSPSVMLNFVILGSATRAGWSCGVRAATRRRRIGRGACPRIATVGTAGSKQVPQQGPGKCKSAVQRVFGVAGAQEDQSTPARRKRLQAVGYRTDFIEPPAQHRRFCTNHSTQTLV